MSQASRSATLQASKFTFPSAAHHSNKNQLDQWCASLCWYLLSKPKQLTTTTECLNAPWNRVGLGNWAWFKAGRMLIASWRPRNKKWKEKEQQERHNRRWSTSSTSSTGHISNRPRTPRRVQRQNKRSFPGIPNSRDIHGRIHGITKSMHRDIFPEDAQSRSRWIDSKIGRKIHVGGK